MRFFYSARDRQGRLTTGFVRAVSREGALALLQGEGLVVTELKVREEASWLERFLRALSFYRTSGRELALFTREFSALVSAKVPILDVLRTAGSEERSPLLMNAISGIIGDVEAGLPLSAALARYPIIFSPFYVEMVKSGELSGNLEGVLSYLAEYEEGRWLLKSRVSGAMVYPALVIFLAIVVGIAMLLLVVPQLEAIFSEVNVPLPLPTRILIGVSNLIVSFWWLLAIIVALGSWWLGQFLRTSEGVYFRDGLLLKLPIFGPLFRRFYLARLTESLSTLISGGIALPQALEVTAAVVGNTRFVAVLKRSAQDVRGGKTLTEAFSSHEELLPPFLSEMAEVGEKTGRVESTLSTAARFYRQEVDRTVANLSNLIEPLLAVVLGVVVAILLAAILLPIYNLSKVL